jgi:hypothetical protein
MAAAGRGILRICLSYHELFALVRTVSAQPLRVSVTSSFHHSKLLIRQVNSRIGIDGDFEKSKF